MKKFKKEVDINIDIYETKLTILYNYNLKEVRKWIKKSGFSKSARKRMLAFYDYNGNRNQGVCHKDGFYYMINLRGYDNVHELINTLSHEIYHCVFGLTEYIKIKLSEDSEEAFAYLNGYLMGEAYKKLVEPLIKHNNKKI